MGASVMPVTCRDTHMKSQSMAAMLAGEHGARAEGAGGLSQVSHMSESSQAAMTNITGCVGFKQQQFVSCSSEVWEAQDQGMGMAAFWQQPPSWLIASAFSLCLCPHKVEGAGSLGGSLI